MNNFRTMMYKRRFSPLRFSGLNLWLSASHFNTLTLSYNAIAETASGTSGTQTITASATVATKVFAGNKIKIGATDIYTVANVSTSTITTVETLTATYASLSALAVGHVSQWNDKSGNGNNATQGTGISQPTFASNILNNKSVITFDGTTSLELPSGLYSISNGDNTIFTVAKTSNASVERIVCGSISSSNRYTMATFNPGSYTFVNSSSGVGLDKSSVTVTNYNIEHATRNGTARSLSVNNGTAATNSTASDVTCTEMFIGSRNNLFDFLTGGIAEILIYNRKLEATEIAQINRYLSNKFAITIL